MFFKAKCVSSKGISKNGRKNSQTAEMLILQDQGMKENSYVLELYR